MIIDALIFFVFGVGWGYYGASVGTGRDLSVRELVQGKLLNFVKKQRLSFWDSLYYLVGEFYPPKSSNLTFSAGTPQSSHIF